MVDLHLHTTCSDGSLTPAEVVAYALTRKVAAIAVTDHDSVAGNEEAVRLGRERGLPVVPGVEISSHWNGVTFHLLGYGLTRLTDHVRQAFDFLVESRAQRNPRMIERLQALGVDISLEEVLAEAGESVVGRPHFARVLLRKRAVGSMQEAFDRYLGRGAAAYVNKERLTPAQSAELIREAGGVMVLAHPGILEEERPGALPMVLEHLLTLGLAGIEVHYSRHTPDQTARYGELARRHGLLVTGGSDFHRPGEGGPDLGTGYGRLHVPDSCYRDLRERLAAA